MVIYKLLFVNHHVENCDKTVLYECTRQLNCRYMNNKAKKEVIARERISIRFHESRLLADTWTKRCEARFTVRHPVVMNTCPQVSFLQRRPRY